MTEQLAALGRCRRPLGGARIPVDDLVKKGAALMALAGAVVIFSAALLICVDVALRMFFASSLRGTVELTGYALAISSSWSFGYALLHRAHVRVDIINSRFPPRVRAILDVLALLVLVFVAGTLAWYGYGVVARSFQTNATSGFSRSFHVWWFQGLWVVGLLGFLLIAAQLATKSASALLRGDLKTVSEIGGTTSQDEEVKSEIEQATIRAKALSTKSAS